MDDIKTNGLVPELNLFSTWIADPAFGLAPEDRGFADDPDGDRLVNGLEAWFGTHPGEFNAGLTILATDLTTTSLSHPQNQNPPEDLTAFYQWSINLSDWYAGDGVDGPVSGPFVTITPGTAAGITTVSATSSAPAERIFLRAGVAQEN